MAYCTRQDLVDRIGEGLLQELTDLERVGAVHEDRVTRTIEDAGARIDSYAMLRYRTPIAPTPPEVRSVCIDLVLYALFSRRGFAEESADEVIARNYKAAIRWLEQLAEGRVALGVAQPPKDPGVQIAARPHLFDRDKMEGF